MTGTSGKTLGIGIAGLGNVGASVARLLLQNAELIESRCGHAIRLVSVSARNKTKDRGVDLSKTVWFDDPLALVDDPAVNIIVELIGGADGPAHALIEKAMAKGKPVVTANKALVSAHARDLAAKGGKLCYEAAVAGGIPAIKGLREGLAANRIRGVYGILNGTCNYILSEMTKTGRAFDDVLAEAQKKGYAESDPTFDVDGIDAAHKLSILAGLAFGGFPDFSAIRIAGIRGVTALDISFAAELGYVIKLLGIAVETPRGIEQTVEPCLVPRHHAVAAVDGALNAVYVDGNFSGKVLFMGAGAGGDATASAVVADIIDLARGHTLPLMATQAPKDMVLSGPDMRIGSYFIRLNVIDQPGVIADVSAILRDCHVSMESVLQRGRAPEQPVPVILTTHETLQSHLQHAVAQIAQLRAVTEPPHVMRIETFE